MNMKYKRHRTWALLLFMLLIYAGSTGILSNCCGVLFAAIIKDMGFRAGDLSVYYLIRSLTTAFFMSVTTRLFFKYKSGIVLALLGCANAGCIGMMCLFTHLWQWYLAAIVGGIGASCVMVVVPIVLSNWFLSKSGLVIGITLSASGIAGALFSPICSRLIIAFGWRNTAVIMSLIGVVTIVLPALFLPFVAPKESCSPSVTAASVSSRTTTAESARLFLLALVAVVAPSSLVQLCNQLPTFSQGIGYSISVGAALTSMAMAGNVTGKLFMGILSDKIGIYRSVRLFLVGIAAAMSAFLFGKQSQIVLYIAAIAYGMVYSIYATAPPLLFKDLYGPEKSREKLTKTQAANSYASALLSVAIPYVYDLTGSYDLVFVLSIFICMISFLIFHYLQKYSYELHMYSSAWQKQRESANGGIASDMMGKGSQK